MDVSSSLMNGLCSHTSEIPFLIDGHLVILTVIPGFSDMVMEDSDDLENLSTFLATVSATYASHWMQLIRITGMRTRRTSSGSSTSIVFRTNAGGGLIPGALGG